MHQETEFHLLMSESSGLEITLNADRWERAGLIAIALGFLLAGGVLVSFLLGAMYQAFKSFLAAFAQATLMTQITTTALIGGVVLVGVGILILKVVPDE